MKTLFLVTLFVLLSSGLECESVSNCAENGCKRCGSICVEAEEICCEKASETECGAVPFSHCSYCPSTKSCIHKTKNYCLWSHKETSSEVIYGFGKTNDDKLGLFRCTNSDWNQSGCDQVQFAELSENGITFDPAVVFSWNAQSKGFAFDEILITQASNYWRYQITSSFDEKYYSPQQIESFPNDLLIGSYKAKFEDETQIEAIMTMNSDTNVYYAQSGLTLFVLHYSDLTFGILDDKFYRVTFDSNGDEAKTVFEFASFDGSGNDGPIFTLEPLENFCGSLAVPSSSNNCQCLYGDRIEVSPSQVSSCPREQFDYCKSSNQLHYDSEKKTCCCAHSSICDVDQNVMTIVCPSADNVWCLNNPKTQIADHSFCRCRFGKKEIVTNLSECEEKCPPARIHFCSAKDHYFFDSSSQECKCSTTDDTVLNTIDDTLSCPPLSCASENTVFKLGFNPNAYKIICQCVLPLNEADTSKCEPIELSKCNSFFANAEDNNGIGLMFTKNNGANAVVEILSAVEYFFKCIEANALEDENIEKNLPLFTLTTENEWFVEHFRDASLLNIDRLFTRFTDALLLLKNDDYYFSFFESLLRLFDSDERIYVYSALLHVLDNIFRIAEQFDSPSRILEHRISTEMKREVYTRNRHFRFGSSDNYYHSSNAFFPEEISSLPAFVSSSQVHTIAIVSPLKAQVELISINPTNGTISYVSTSKFTVTFHLSENEILYDCFSANGDCSTTASTIDRVECECENPGTIELRVRPPKEEPKESSTGLSTGAIVGIVIGVVVFFVVIVIVLVWFFVIRNSNHIPLSIDMESHTKLEPETETIPETAPEPENQPQLDYEK